jgi:hypothetical protein
MPDALAVTSASPSTSLTHHSTAFYKITKKHDKIVKRLLEGLAVATTSPAAVLLLASFEPALSLHMPTPGPVPTPGEDAGVTITTASGSVVPGAQAVAGTGGDVGGRGPALALVTSLMGTFMSNLEDQPFLRVLNSDR